VDFLGGVGLWGMVIGGIFRSWIFWMLWVVVGLVDRMREGGGGMRGKDKRKQTREEEGAKWGQMGPDRGRGGEEEWEREGEIGDES